VRALYLAFILMLLAGCGQSFSGDYQDAVGITYSFQKEGRVTVTAFGVERIFAFTREGDTLKIGEEGTRIILNILDDGSLKSEGLTAIHLKPVE